MFNPRSLVYALYTHWDTVEVLVRLSREFAIFTSDQALTCITSVSPQLDDESQGAILRALVNADILQTLPRSSDLQLNAYVLEFVRGLTREHELGLTAVLQARVACEQLTVQGALYSHRLQFRQVAHQAKELRRFGRLVALQCSDTLLPLREELRQHNALSSAISALLGQIRKRGLRRTLSRATENSSLPLWRNERGFKLQLGDEVRGVMAAVRHFVPQSVAFPHDEPIAAEHLLERVNETGIREHLQRSLPVDSLLDWLQTHYGQLQDATLLRLFHDLQHEPGWQCEPADVASTTDLQTIRVLHYPHRMSNVS